MMAFFLNVFGDIWLHKKIISLYKFKQKLYLNNVNDKFKRLMNWQHFLR